LPSDTATYFGTPGTVLFPPRNEPFDFGNRLNDKYRDQLHGAPVASFVNLEGYIVWIQEYLRYRVSGCSHETAVQKVFSQIDGGGISPDCAGTAPQPPPTPGPTACAYQFQGNATTSFTSSGGSSPVTVALTSGSCTFTAATDVP